MITERASGGVHRREHGAQHPVGGPPRITRRARDPFVVRGQRLIDDELLDFDVAQAILAREPAPLGFG